MGKRGMGALMDEVFGDDNLVATVIWEKVYSPKSSAKFFSDNHDFIVVYARNKELFELGLLPRTEQADARYTNPDDDPRGPWKPGGLDARNPYSKGRYPIECPCGRLIQGPPRGNYWPYSKQKFLELDADGRIWWGEDQNQVPAIKRFLSEVRKGLVPETIWTYQEVGHTQRAKKTLLEISPDHVPDIITTTKPVELLKQVIALSADEDSIILDSFAGSGTTAHAVLALNQEDGRDRRFVLIECEDYADSVTAKRVRRVIKGVPSARDASLKAGLGGTFSYFELGAPMQQEALLAGPDLPAYDALVGYVFFTATGDQFDPRKVDRESGFIGNSRGTDVYLIYAPDRERIKDLALTLEFARALPKPRRSDRLVFAPTKYLDEEFLEEYRISFCQLPFQIYEAIESFAGGGVQRAT